MLHRDHVLDTLHTTIHPRHPSTKARIKVVKWFRKRLASTYTPRFSVGQQSTNISHWRSIQFQFIQSTTFAIPRVGVESWGPNNSETVIERLTRRLHWIWAFSLISNKYSIFPIYHFKLSWFDSIRYKDKAIQVLPIQHTSFRLATIVGVLFILHTPNSSLVHLNSFYSNVIQCISPSPPPTKQE